jgi:hypothetical protein
MARGTPYNGRVPIAIIASGKAEMMRQPVLTLERPADVYERLRRAAKGMNRPMEKALVDIIRAATPSLEKRRLSTVRNSTRWKIWVMQLF